MACVDIRYEKYDSLGEVYMGELEYVVGEKNGWRRGEHGHLRYYLGFAVFQLQPYTPSLPRLS